MRSKEIARYSPAASLHLPSHTFPTLSFALSADRRFNAGAGYDQIDVSACTSHNIHVSNTPGAVDDATADTAVFLIIGALRGYNKPMTTLRSNNWRGNPLPPLGHDPEGKTLGILGMGGIGKNLAQKMAIFGMRVIYHNRRKLDEKEEGGASYKSFEDLLKESDVISLNLPLNVSTAACFAFSTSSLAIHYPLPMHCRLCRLKPLLLNLTQSIHSNTDFYLIQPSTKHIISMPQFKLMRHGVVIINTARGAVMDEAALVKALDNGIVGSIGLDVFEKEPEIHPGLVANEKVLLLPHMGTWTVETQTAMEKLVVSNVRKALKEGVLATRVPEQEGMSYK